GGGRGRMVRAAGVGGTGLFAPLACIAPELIGRLYDSCRTGNLFEARAAQEQVAALRQAMKPADAPTLKAALRHMGRDCGDPRPPLLPLDAAATQALADRLAAIPALAAEPRGGGRPLRLPRRPGGRDPHPVAGGELRDHLLHQLDMDAGTVAALHVVELAHQIDAGAAGKRRNLAKAAQRRTVTDAARHGLAVAGRD